MRSSRRHPLDPRRHPAFLGLLGVAVSTWACGGAARDESAARGAGTSVQQHLEIRNEAPESVVVTARVGASPEQQLGVVEPAVSRLFTIETGAASTRDIFLRARNPRTGNEAIETLQVTPGETLNWVVRF